MGYRDPEPHRPAANSPKRHYTEHYHCGGEWSASAHQRARFTEPVPLPVGPLSRSGGWPQMCERPIGDCGAQRMMFLYHMELGKNEEQGLRARTRKRGSLPPPR